MKKLIFIFTLLFSNFLIAGPGSALFNKFHISASPWLYFRNNALTGNFEYKLTRRITIGTGIEQANNNFLAAPTNNFFAFTNSHYDNDLTTEPLVNYVLNTFSVRFFDSKIYNSNRGTYTLLQYGIGKLQTDNKYYPSNIKNDDVPFSGQEIVDMLETRSTEYKVRTGRLGVGNNMKLVGKLYLDLGFTININLITADDDIDAELSKYTLHTTFNDARLGQISRGTNMLQFGTSIKAAIGINLF
jgi:hypothetical protein